MIRYLPIIIEIALLVYAFLDCVGTHETRVRNLPKTLWLVIVVLIPIAGPLAWLFAGRPARATTAVTTWPLRPVPSEPSRDRPLGPDDDPEFMAKLKRSHDDEKLMKQWEDDLKRRERELRGEDEADGPGEAKG